MIYTEDISRAVRRIPVPSGFVMDIIEFEGPGGFLMLRFYSGQWIRFSELERGRCAEYLAKVQQKIGEFGVNATLDPVLGNPPK